MRLVSSVSLLIAPRPLAQHVTPADRPLPPAPFAWEPLKFYAKTAGLPRTEVCCDNRRAVRLAASHGGAAWPDGPARGGSGVAGRLRVLALAAVPMLDAMAAHLALLDLPQREVLVLITALAPQPRGGALPPSGRPGARTGQGNHGNSGGPLFNLRGEVAELNWALVSDIGGSIGLGLAILANDAAAALDSMRRSSRLNTGFPGMNMQGLTPALAHSFGVGGTGGCIVTEI